MIKRYGKSSIARRCAASNGTTASTARMMSAISTGRRSTTRQCPAGSATVARATRINAESLGKCVEERGALGGESILIDDRRAHRAAMISLNGTCAAVRRLENRSAS